MAGSEQDRLVRAIVGMGPVLIPPMYVSTISCQVVEPFRFGTVILDPDLATIVDVTNLQVGHSELTHNPSPIPGWAMASRDPVFGLLVDCLAILRDLGSDDPDVVAMIARAWSMIGWEANHWDSGWLPPHSSISLTVRNKSTALISLQAVIIGECPERKRHAVSIENPDHDLVCAV